MKAQLEDARLQDDDGKLAHALAFPVVAQMLVNDAVDLAHMLMDTR